ncbi:hypothetical protein QR680_018901 [Steinernema hermaphroditum]|uniref:Non-specific protein-tyrosine kinase n=1 Tax=Steinernema hermaphroditum TaxID=289476 RepID=A0AA39LRJ4_9BILA|nr:hypothetical protein QR680_018901 [Steinernema hermaphroditum]
MKPREETLNELGEKLYSTVQTAGRTGLPVSSIYHQFKHDWGRDLNLRPLGFSSLNAFVAQISQFVKLVERDGKEWLVPVDAPETAHIAHLINRTRENQLVLQREARKKNRWKSTSRPPPIPSQGMVIPAPRPPQNNVPKPPSVTHPGARMQLPYVNDITSIRSRAPQGLSSSYSYGQGNHYQRPSKATRPKTVHYTDGSTTESGSALHPPRDFNFQAWQQKIVDAKKRAAGLNQAARSDYLHATAGEAPRQHAVNSTKSNCSSKEGDKYNEVFKQPHKDNEVTEGPYHEIITQIYNRLLMKEDYFEVLDDLVPDDMKFEVTAKIECSYRSMFVVDFTHHGMVITALLEIGDDDTESETEFRDPDWSLSWSRPFAGETREPQMTVTDGKGAKDGDVFEQSSKKVRKKPNTKNAKSSMQRKSNRRESECEQSIKKTKKKPVPIRKSAMGKAEGEQQDEKEVEIVKEVRVKKRKKEGSEGSDRIVKKSMEVEQHSKNSVMKKCEHAWPTAADMEALKDTPKPWKRPMPAQNEIEWYYSRMPTWFIEEKMLRNPGDFLVSRDHSNKMRLSVKTNEPNNPIYHHPIEFTITRQVKNDRNYYYRLVGTVLQANSIWNLIDQYQKSISVFRHNTNRDAELLNGVLPCLGCLYGSTEYSFHYIQVKSPDDLIYGEQICKGETSTIYKAMRLIYARLGDRNPRQRPVLVKELDEYNEEVLDQIYREMHIVNTLRHKIGWNTALNIEGICTIRKPYVICYKFCKGGALMQYIDEHKNEIDVKARLTILEDLSCTMYQIIEMGILHCDLSARNIFVDLKEMTMKNTKPIFYIGGFRFAVMAKTKKVNPDKLGNARWCAPEVYSTETLNEQTEVYSFAMLMLETLTGELPYKNVDNKHIKQVLKETPELRPEIPSWIPKDVSLLICDAYSGIPEKRPKMKELWRRLRTFNKEQKSK